MGGNSGRMSEGRGGKEQKGGDKSTVENKSLEESTFWAFMPRITGI